MPGPFHKVNDPYILTNGVTRTLLPPCQYQVTEEGTKLIQVDSIDTCPDEADRGITDPKGSEPPLVIVAD